MNLTHALDASGRWLSFIVVARLDRAIQAAGCSKRLETEFPTSFGSPGQAGRRRVILRSESPFSQLGIRFRAIRFRDGERCPYRHSANAIDRRTFTLPVEQSSFIDELVSTGRYASASEVVRAGLHALQERDQAVERWLSEEVARTYDAMKADPERAVPVDRAFAAVRARLR